MDFPLKRKTQPELRRAQLEAVRRAFWDNMDEDGPEHAALREALDRSGLLSEPASYDEVKVLMGLLPRETLGAAISFGFGETGARGSIELFLLAYAQDLRQAFGSPDAYRWDRGPLST